MIYLDYAATAPMAPKAIEALSNNLNSKEMYANPSSLQHSFGQKANNLVKNCRSEFASDLNCNPNDLIFTSGATESNNLAIKGIALSYRYKGQHIVTSASEHKSVLDTCKFLESIGFQVTYLRPDTNGRIDQDCLLAALTDKTTLVSLMHVNNETGVIQDIDQIAKSLKQKDIFFHVDAAQSAGKLQIDLTDSGRLVPRKWQQSHSI